jgi:hypothetical protein
MVSAPSAAVGAPACDVAGGSPKPLRYGGFTVSNAELVAIGRDLDAHVQACPAGACDQIVHDVLSRYDLTPTEHYGVLDAFRRCSQIPSFSYKSSR